MGMMRFPAKSLQNKEVSASLQLALTEEGTTMSGKTGIVELYSPYVQEFSKLEEVLKVNNFPFDRHSFQITESFPQERFVRFHPALDIVRRLEEESHTEYIVPLNAVKALLQGQPEELEERLRTFIASHEPEIPPLVADEGDLKAGRLYTYNKVAYKVIDDKSVYYGYEGPVVYETNESVCVQLVTDLFGNRCYEGRVQFPKKDLKKIVE